MSSGEGPRLSQVFRSIEALLQRLSEELGNAEVQLTIAPLHNMLESCSQQFPIVHDGMDPNELLGLVHGRKALPVHVGGSNTHLVPEAAPGAPAKAAGLPDHDVELDPRWLADERWSLETLCGRTWVGLAVDPRFHLSDLPERLRCTKCWSRLA